MTISLVTFFISTNAPGDPVEQMMTTNDGEGASSKRANEEAYNQKRQELGLNLPIFYFAFTNAASTDTLYRIPKPAHRNTLSRLLNDYGNWDQISDYYYKIRGLEEKLADVKKDGYNATALIQLRESVNFLYRNTDKEKVKFNLDGIQKTMVEMETTIATADSEMPDSIQTERPTNRLVALNAPVQDLMNSYSEMQSSATKWKNLVPAFSWYGVENQYHNWFFGNKPLFGNGDGTWNRRGFIRGDFGISYKDQRPVSSVLIDAVRWTFGLSLISIIITYLLAIPLGIFSARSKGTAMDQIITTILFILYALPSFWVATLFVIYLCGGDYLNLFPAVFSPDFSGGFFSDVKEIVYYMALPLICWTYSGFAYLSRQMRGGMLNVLGQDYIRTAKSKGLSDGKITWKHALRNSLLPIITLFASVFPAAIGGSIVLEIIFSIPGMGKVGYEAVVGRNYPIVFAVMMFSSILVLIGYLVADILYSVVDPRISFNDK